MGEVWEGSAQQTKEGTREEGLVLWERCGKITSAARPGVLETWGASLNGGGGGGGGWMGSAHHSADPTATGLRSALATQTRGSRASGSVTRTLSFWARLSEINPKAGL